MPSGAILSNAYIATRVGTTKQIADTATFTTEASLMTVTPFLTSGRLYGVTGRLRIGYSAGTLGSAETIIVRIREDSSVGNQIGFDQHHILTTSGNGITMDCYATYTALSTATKTFVFTAQRVGASTSTFIGRATSNSPGFLLVDFIPE